MKYRPLILIAAFGMMLVACGPKSEEQAAKVESGPEIPIQSGQVLSADETPIFYESTGSGKTALVFVHGWCCDHTYWSEQVDRFSGDYQVVTLDLAGHGESGLNRTDWTASRFAEDVVAVADHLNLNRIVLIGHSMGGTVVVEVAARMPERVAGLVAVDTLQNVERKWSEEDFNAFVGPMEADFVKTTTEFVTKGLFTEDADPELANRVATNMAQCPPEIGVAMMRAMFNQDIKPVLDTLDIPIRLINSDLYPTDMEANRRHMKDAELILLDGLGHFPQMEDPERFNDALQRVVDDILRTGPERQNP